jgi:hypothetical protein
MEKVIDFNGGATGLTLYMTIMRKTHGTYLDADDLTFQDPDDANPYIVLEELELDETDSQMYEWRDDTNAWKDGQYIVTIYEQAGLTPAIDTDAILATATLNIHRNAIRERRYSYSGR